MTRGPQANLWNDADVVQLRRLRARGLSTNLIAREMGRTKNAIVGKIDRMGGLPVPEHLVQAPRVMPERPKISKPEKHRDPAAAPQWKPKPRPLQPQPEPGKFKCIPIDELTSATCRYPMWEDHGDPTRLYCGDPVIGEGPYCLLHSRLVVQP